MKCKLLLFDLDGTLLQTDKTISKVTMQELEKCRNQGIMIGVSTSRSEKNSLEFIAELNPDVLLRLLNIAIFSSHILQYISACYA